jgi:two-component system nitrogen regulation response regulator GlnG/two-component system response regulator HydG
LSAASSTNVSPNDTQPDSVSASEGAVAPPMMLALALVWCREAPHRIGELLLPPPGSPGPPRVFGRGPSRVSDSQPRLLLVRDRPGSSETTEPLDSQRLSREQLMLRVRDDQVIEVTNLGQAPIRIDGKEAASGTLRVGSTLQVGSQLVLFCIERPAWMQGSWAKEALHPFGEPDGDGIVGESPAAWEIRHQIAFVAPLAGHALIVGGSGTGKELVARAIHGRSQRGRRPLVSRNAATLPDTLIDSELFGNLRGYPNPGMPERPGLIGQADGSTLFLDEIGELPEAAQAHLLRLLDGGEYQRLGDARVRKADVRVIAATNRSQSLRPEFHLRFGLRVDLPDLDARREDVPLIGRCIANQQARREPGTWARFLSDDRAHEVKFAPDFVRALVAHRYPGNVRELESLLWASVRESRAGRLETPRALAPAVGAVDAEDAASSPATDPALLDPAEIQQCLAQHGGSIESTWRALNLTSRHVLVRLIKKHGLTTR